MAKRIIKKSVGSRGRAGLSKNEKRSIKGTFKVRAGSVLVAGKKSGAARGGVLRCEDCAALWFDKHWHAPSVLEGIDLANASKGLCEECRRARRSPKGAAAPYAGEVTLDGEFSPKEKEEILGLVRNVGKRAMSRNPEDRIVRIAEMGGTIKVYTTENQLAVSIGKQVHGARKGSELTIVWSHDDMPVRVHWRKK